MGWGSIAGAAISTVGSMASSAMNNRSAKQMAATSAQTRVKDLRAAGLNPILAATNGSLQAAQVPQQQSPDYSPIARVFEQNTGRMNANSARQQADNNTKQVESTVALQGAQSAKTLADTKVALNQVDVQNAQKNLINEQALTQSALRANYAANTGLASANALRANYQAVQDRVNADFYNSTGGRDAVNTNNQFKQGTVPGIINVLERVPHLFGVDKNVAAVLATWFTFLPSFLFILAGGPFIETTHNNINFTAPLTAITAAVVGVILNLALFFGYHVLWPQGFDGKMDWIAAVIAFAAAIALFRFKYKVTHVIAACAVIGLILHLFLRT